ncbi:MULTISPECIES: CtsR family transcriptional regulator [Paenibacillus]|jgi:transcriptional regulator CtsR|uniref:Transcriptional regulator CtsR n=2 Tax=Paenibacillus barengoltzii TaxID=343517 RepID=R9LJP2_9BACL|nr:MULTISPECIES: CtsR family transcriptional regulator [Paenibacillus]EOS59004.1 transcriptional regulator CtsR [Paenibacillus barengoltzii G22]MDU0329321.1 CtsR family transcriptional regulator [Paenibacillus sp. 3LSP]MEC2346358.1 CtsR family transcriptional regulator [Paenibacillus barengoltzii]SMF31758.1 transcriptional regulator CtsR [Paenibacillus barengoltzii J12]SMF64814.1 transcriptional regulator CtsR [Paenibacillus barengoltzii]
MRNISDIIEKYLKSILHESPEGIIEIQRNELADQFSCVPSQINYVISTRFTLEKGYLVESKRGGGGYVRIRRLQLPGPSSLHTHLHETIGEEIGQSAAEGLIYRLEEARVLTPREAAMMRSAISRDVLAVKLPYRDQIRARLMRAMLISLLS